MPRRLASAFGMLALVLVSLAIPFAGGEVLLRLIPERNSYALREGGTKARFNPYIASGHLAYELRPNWSCVHGSREFEVTVRTNELGLRGALESAHKKEGTFRVVMLGDSFVFGFGVEDDETLPARLEEILRSQGRRVEILNAGVPGWSADQYYLFLKGRLESLDPDLVVLGLFANDVGDLMWHRLQLDEDRLPIRIQSTRRLIDQRGRMRYVNEHRFALPSVNFPGRVWLQDHSQLYHWLRFRLIKAWLGIALKAEARRWNPYSGKEPVGSIPSLSASEIQRALERSAAFRLRYHQFLIDSIVLLCRDRGVALRVVQLPPNGDTSAAAGMREDCAARGDQCLDLTPLLPRGHVEELYFRSDPHWNAAGHRWAAEVIASWLESDLPAPRRF